MLPLIGTVVEDIARRLRTRSVQPNAELQLAMTMASAIQTATTTGRDGSVSQGPKAPNGISDTVMNGSRPAEIPKETLQKWKSAKKPANKYRHVTAFHSKAQVSCLSNDYEAATSFVGFRNLMVLVLSMFADDALSWT